MIPHAIHILAVDDEPALCELTKSFLESSEAMEVDAVCSVAEARTALGKKHYDAIVSDYQMPKEDGIQFLKSLRGRGDQIPFILFTGKGREDVVIEALNNGADSYLQKGGEPAPMYVELEHRIRAAVKKHRSEKAQQEGEARYERLAEHAGTIAWETDAEGLFTYVSNVSEAVWGYRPDELVGKKHFYDLHPKSDREDFKKAALAIFERRERFHDLVNPVRTKDGRTMWVTTDGIPLLNEDGTLHGYQGSDTDTTDRKKTEAALQESEAHYHTIYDGSPIAIEIYDAKGSLMHANPACLELFGVEDANEIGGFSLFADPNINEERKEELRQGSPIRYQGPFDFEKVRALDLYRTRRSGIIELDVLITPLSGKEESVMGFLVQIQDITKRKLAEDALREGNARLQTLLQTIPDLIWLKDTEGVYISCNSTFERFFGAKEADIVGKTDYEFVDRELADFFLERDRAAMAAGKPTSNEEWVTFANDGHCALLETIKTPLYGVKGDLVGVLGIGRDITMRKQAEEALRNASIKLGILNSITRHDITNQLLVLQGNLALLGRGHLLPSSNAHLQKAEVAAEQVSAMIQFTKEYQDIGVKAPAWVSPGRQTADAFAVLHPVGVELEDDIRGVEVFADLLAEKVPYNLIDNSMRHGEHVTCIKMSAEQRGDTMLIVYEDDGVGISEKDKKRLFEKGFGKNTGFGLFLCREILAITGITITETGKAGKGVRFEMLVPAGAWRLPPIEQ